MFSLLECYSMRDVAVIYPKDLSSARRHAAVISDKLNSMGILVKVVEIKEEEIASYNVPPTDAVICLGGDGTLLRVLSLVGSIPVLLLNMGAKGYLAEFTPMEFLNYLNSFIEESFLLETHYTLASYLNGEKLWVFVNDLVVSVSQPTQMIYLNLFLDETSYPIPVEGNGVIVATTLGSTGFSMNAGGSILAPQSKSIILTPICARSPIRPIVIPYGNSITLKPLRKDIPMLLIADGFRTHPFSCGETLSIKPTNEKVNLIRFNADFFSRRIERLGK